jgi:hypothetical protein
MGWRLPAKASDGAGEEPAPLEAHPSYVCPKGSTLPANQPRIGKLFMHKV